MGLVLRNQWFELAYMVMTFFIWATRLSKIRRHKFIIRRALIKVFFHVFILFFFYSDLLYILDRYHFWLFRLTRRIWLLNLLFILITALMTMVIFIWVIFFLLMVIIKNIFWYIIFWLSYQIWHDILFIYNIRNINF